ncbi:MAG: D-2-hydroxyacid dehydrogenase [Chloroflexi bacterium]|nr:D-2-hydroxyacid dehydrogenase [Chloroflexota bacterium]
MTKILIASQQEDSQRIAEIQARHPEVELVAVHDRDHLLDQIGDADGMLGHVTAMEFAAAEQIRWIQAGSAGVEWLWNVPTLQGRDDVVVTNMRSAHAATIAEHLYAMLLSFTRALPAFAKLQEQSHWGRGWMPGMTAIKGLTMGIVGFGNIGRAIARRAEGFEMNVLAVDAFPGEPGNGVAEVWPLSRLDEMCSQIDVLAISAPITPQTRGLIGPKQIALLRPGAYVMVMSRGNIVDEPALIEALKSGHVAAAGLDVTHEEPLSSDDPLWKAPNCIITPHISALSRLTMDLVWSIFEENLGRFKRGEPLMNVVDKRLGY